MVAIKRASRAKGQRRVRAPASTRSQRIRTQAAIRARAARRLGGHRRAYGTAADPRLPARNCYFEVEIGGRAAMRARPKRASTHLWRHGRRSRQPSARRRLAGSRHPLSAYPRSASARLQAAPASPVVPDQCNLWVDRRLLPGGPASRRSPNTARRCSGTCALERTAPAGMAAHGAWPLEVDGDLRS